MDMITVSAKSVDEAITKALIELETTSDKLEYEIVDKGSNGILGFIGQKPAVIRARKKETLEDKATDFLSEVFSAMDLEVRMDVSFHEGDRELSIVMSGDDMGILIGKRGQTLDSLQYLVSLVVNKESEEYIRVKLDTENYRERRKETLETLSKNIAYKVKRTKRSVSLEPMNPYERRIIHSALQNDKFVVTRSEGEEPFRHVVISLKREYPKKERNQEKDK
jgi:spoIIIJ-associated protein